MAEPDQRDRHRVLPRSPEAEAYGPCRRFRQHAPAAHARGRRSFVAALVASETKAVTIFGKTWDLHVTEVLRTTLDENLAMIADTVAYLKRYAGEVIYDAEHFFDGYRANREYAMGTLSAAADAGADCLVLCDTNGGLLPDEFLAIWREVRKIVKGKLGVHCHNDSGCAEANSCLAVIEGADQVQGTINGLGERCGNANLCTIVPDLQLKRGIPLLPPARLQLLTPVSVFVAEVANVTPPVGLPYVGEAAFSHKAGRPCRCRAQGAGAPSSMWRRKAWATNGGL